MKGKLNIANVVTASRIIFAILVLLSDAFSRQFYILYIIGAFTDMIDGTIARKMNTKSVFGSMLDTIADFAFVIAVGVTVLSSLYVPVWLWLWIILVAFIKIINLISSLYLFRKIVPMHTLMNKISGMILFFLPFGIGKGAWQASTVAVVITGCVVTFAAIQEGYYIWIGKEME